MIKEIIEGNIVSILYFHIKNKKFFELVKFFFIICYLILFFF
jgi:hypothetical protein